MRILPLYSAILDRVNRAGVLACMASIAGLIAITGWQVVGRYVLNMPPIWAESVSMLLILVVAFVGGALCVRDGSHLSLRFFVEGLAPRRRKAFAILSAIVVLGFGLAMLLGGTQAASQVWAVRDPTLPVSRGSYYVPIAIAGALVLLFQVERLARLLLATQGNGGEAR